jgi:hypothetical protein
MSALNEWYLLFRWAQIIGAGPVPSDNELTLLNKICYKKSTQV